MNAITIPETDWERTGSDEDPGSRLLTRMTINGHYFHIEAISVRDDDENIQVVQDQDFAPEFDALHTIAGNDGGPFSTQMILGREYVVVVTPHK